MIKIDRNNPESIRKAIQELQVMLNNFHLSSVEDSQDFTAITFADADTGLIVADGNGNTYRIYATKVN